jgi:hypothetical protein
MRRIVVTHHGIPLGRVGTLRLTTGDLLVGELECVEAYAALRPTIWEVSRSLWSVGFLASGLDVSRMSPAAPEVLERAAELDLELRDEDGALVPTDFVNIVERPFVEMLPVVFARLRLAPAAMMALMVPSEPKGLSKSV